jgi:hypothetical protein
MEHLLTKIRTNQEKIKAGHKELMTIMETNREKMLAKLDAHHEGMMVRINSQLENTEVTDLEANPEEIQSKQSMKRSLRKRPQWKFLEH